MAALHRQRRWSRSRRAWLAAGLAVLLGPACQHAPPAPAAHDLRARLASVAIHWEDPRLQAAADALQASGRPLLELQARASQLLAEHGAPASQLVLARDGDPDLDAEIARLAPARCASAGPPPSLVLCCRDLLDLDAVPTALAAGELMLVSGRTLRQVRVDEALLLDCRGRISALRVEQRDRQFSATAGAPLTGRTIVELMVTSERGREVAALWEVTVTGLAAASSGCPATQPASAGDFARRHADDTANPGATSRAFFAGLGADRAAASLAPLTWSDRLSAFARERARELASAGQLIHTPAERLAQLRDDRGLPLSWFGENVARGQGVDDVRAAFLRSPSHRRNHLAADASSAGIGAAWQCQDRRCTLFLVEILARAYAPIDAAGLIREVVQRINQQRLSRGAAALDVDAGLTATAQQRARHMADLNQLLGDSPDEPALTHQLMASRGDLLAAGAAVFRVDSAAGVELRPLLLRPEYNVVGVGVARHDQRSPWYVAVIVAENGEPVP